jgi:hypothetical protein
MIIIYYIILLTYYVTNIIIGVDIFVHSTDKRLLFQ